MTRASPESVARMRLSIASRIWSMKAAPRSHRPAGAGGFAGLIAPSAKPTAPMPWK
jgi:hypothetical protein